jgi:hypothetical protein
VLVLFGIWLPAVTVQDQSVSVASSTTGQTIPVVVQGPHREPQLSLVRDYGYEVLWRVAVPLVVSLVVLWLLAIAARRADSTGQAARNVAWFLSGLLMLAALIGFVTFFIGVYVVPTGALLLAACLSSRTGRQLASRPQLA